MIREGRADFTSVKSFRNFLFEQQLCGWLLFIFWREKDEWRQVKDTAEKRRLFELNMQDHYTACISVKTRIQEHVD